jgi:hypothetical protein
MLPKVLTIAKSPKLKNCYLYPMQIKLFQGLGLLITLVAFAFLTESAQTNNKPKTAGTDTTSKKSSFAHLKASMGCKPNNNTSIQAGKTDAYQLLKNKVCVMDTKTNTTLTVRAFEMIYCEKGLYEDSTGTPTVVTDCQLVPFDGDSIATDWMLSLQDRLYRGDSIAISNIIAVYEGKSVKIKDRITIAIR